MTDIVLGTIDKNGKGTEILRSILKKKTGRDFIAEDYVFADPEPLTITQQPITKKVRIFADPADDWYEQVTTTNLSSVNISKTSNQKSYEFYKEPQTLGPRNTRIRLFPKAHTGKYGPITIYYDRIVISQLGELVIPTTVETTTLELLNYINSRFGILLTGVDIINSTLPTVDPVTKKITTTFKINNNKSIVFCGETSLIIGQFASTPITPPPPSTTP